MTSRIIMSDAFSFLNVRGTRHPILRMGAGVQGDGSLSDVIDSACCDLDATIAASYTSGQTWANLIAAPADGAAQTDYDFHRGLTDTVTTDDPTFAGTAGDSAAYWNFDGGDFFKLAAANLDPDDGSLNPTAIKNASKGTGGTDFTVFIAFRMPSEPFNSSLTIFDNRVRTNGTNQNGILILLRPNTPEIRILQEQGNTNSIVNFSKTLVADTDYLLAIAHDHTANETYLALNETSFTSTSHTFTAGTNDPDAGAGIFSDARGVGLIQSGSRLYNFSWANEKVSDADLALVVTHLEARHERDYTP